MKDGTLYQRHLRSCPRDGDGKPVAHKCRGSWSYVVDAGREAGGRRVQLTKGGFATRAEARQALRQVADQMRVGVGHTAGLMVAEYLELWLAGKRRLRPSTAKSYGEHIRLYLAPEIGGVRLNALSAQHIDDMYTRIAAQPRRRPMSPATVRRVHSTLRTALNAALRRRLIPYNPAGQVELPAEHRSPVVVWSPEQLREFLSSIRDDRLYALFHVVALTGMRRGEVCGLRWEDVDFDSRVVRVRQQVVQLAGRCHIGPPKTKSGTRTIALDRGTAEVLRAHRCRQNLERDRWGDAWVDSGLVFTREDGTLLLPNHVTYHFRALVQRAGLPIIRFHGLRHTAASVALAAGVAMKTVSDRLGHSSTAITADLYTHVSPAVAQDAADRIAEVIAGRTARPNRGRYGGLAPSDVARD